MFLTLITVIHIVVCAFLICIVLLQQGKGADMGATFGGGGNTLFGASGADNLLTKVTTVTAFIFMMTSVYLSMAAKPSSAGRSGNLFQSIPENSEVPTGEPAAPINAPAAEAAPASGAAASVDGTATAGAATSVAPVENSNAAPAAEASAPVPAAHPPTQPSASAGSENGASAAQPEATN